MARANHWLALAQASGPLWPGAVGALAVAAGYYAGAQAGFLLHFPGSPLSIIWPPNALLLAALLLVPTRQWPLLLLAVLPAHLLVLAQNGVPLPTLLGLYLTNCAEPVLAAAGVRRFANGPPWFASVRQVALYIVCAALAAPLVTSFLDVGIVVLTRWDTSAHYWLLWQERFASNMLTYLTVTPVLLLGASAGPDWRRTASRGEWLEATALGLGVAGTAVLAFHLPRATATSLPVLLYAPVPVLLWAVLRFGVGGSSAALLGLTLLAATPQAASAVFEARSPAAGVLAVQVFLTVLAGSVLLFAAFLTERQQAAAALREAAVRRETEAALRASDERYRRIVETAQEGIWLIDGDARTTYVNQRVGAMLGYRVEQMLGRELWSFMSADEAASMRQGLERRRQGFSAARQFEATLRRQDGTEVQALVSTVALTDAGGQYSGSFGMLTDITERVRAEEALRASETRLRAVIGSLPVAVYAFDLQGTYTLDEGRLMEQMQRPPGSRLGQSIYERHRDRPEHLSTFERARSGERITFTASSPDGGVVVEHHLAPLRDRQGQIVGVIGVATDITERTRAEDALRQSEERYRGLFEAQPVGILLLDRSGTILLSNPAAQEIVGVPAARLQGRSALDPAYAPTDADGTPLPEADRPFVRALRSGAPVRDVLLGTRRPDGTRLWLLVSAYPLRDATGAVTQVLQTFMDITARTEAEEALRQSERRLRTLIAAAPIGICTTDAQLRFTAVNDAFCALTGYTRAELSGADLRRLFPAEQRAALQAEAAHRWAGEGQEPGEYPLRTKGGERRTVLVNGVTLPGPAGPPERLSFVLDITARTRMEEALRQANAALEQATAAKSAFLATMSHEMRTPLNGVIGLTSLLRGTPLSPQQHEYVSALHTSGEALLSLISDILDFSKIEAEQLILEQQPFDLRGLVREVVGLFAAQAQIKGVRLHAHVDPVVPPLLLGDAGRLRQVLLNLVGNALKFTAQGEVSLTVTLADETAADALLWIGVRDTGIGIAPEAQEGLFAPFVQADASTTRRYGGTGLGLAIAKRLVEAMSGRIGVQSAPGQGSTFWLTVRLADARMAADTPHHEAAIEPVEAGTEERRGRILVAEDNAVNRLVAVGLLERLGYAVEAVETGHQAVERVRADAFDLVLMDVHMPEMDGLAATAAIRQQETAAGQGRHVPIVALTADALARDAERSLAAGMDDHVTKPLTAERLGAVLERWVSASAAGT